MLRIVEKEVLWSFVTNFNPIQTCEIDHQNKQKKLLNIAYKIGLLSSLVCRGEYVYLATLSKMNQTFTTVPLKPISKLCITFQVWKSSIGSTIRSTIQCWLEFQFNVFFLTAVAIFCVFLFFLDHPNHYTFLGNCPPTPPLIKPTLTCTSHLGQNVGLGEG